MQKLYTVQPGSVETADVAEALFLFKTQFKEAMDDDLNISLTLSALFTLVRTINPILVGKKISSSEFTEIDQVLRNVNSVLQIMDFTETGLPIEVQTLLSRRDMARQRKEFAEADRLRDQICARGYRLIDLKDKTICTQCSQKESQCPE
jgi:cysteinyl-tRNA synthetase